MDNCQVSEEAKFNNSVLKPTAKEFVPSKISGGSSGYESSQNRRQPDLENHENVKSSRNGYYDKQNNNSRNFRNGYYDRNKNNNRASSSYSRNFRNCDSFENLDNAEAGASSSNSNSGTDRNGYHHNSQQSSNNNRYTGAVKKRFPPYQNPANRNYQQQKKDNSDSSNSGSRRETDNHYDRNYQSRNHKINNYRNQYENNRIWRSTEDRYYEDNNDRQKNNRSQNNNTSSNYRNAGNFKNQNQSQRRHDYRNSNKQFTKEKEQNINILTQREKLTQEIQSGKLECMICCEYVKNTQSTWNCLNCYHILHLNCITKWAVSSKSDEGWRCVACQEINKHIPREYLCFCGRTKNPQFNHNELPHSCGEVCRKTDMCNHPCALLCHPGKCPAECQSFVVRSCGCGKTNKTFQCSQKVQLLCENKCEKLLNCGVHKCQENCHDGECASCLEQIEHSCFCGKEKKNFDCTTENNLIKSFPCENLCGKKLNCLNHSCKKQCHEGPCDNCELSPDLVTHCHCGKFPIAKGQRKSCLDPIPTCKAVCNKPLKCGPLSAPHTCQSRCHQGVCSSCNKNSSVKCRCGRIEEIIKCKNLSDGKDIRCKKKCTKFRSCGKHKCNAECCIEIEHICNQNCNRILNCRRHKCDRKCHMGNCSNCPRVSFDELSCECGAEIIFPPVACGTKKPICSKPCTRQHSCDHAVLHSCHADAKCPPCVIFTTKYCFGKHEQRKTIPCNQDSFSCGMACDKPLPCGHKCIRPCHENDCMKPNEVCKQKCTVAREDCEHPCGVPCHRSGSCPDTPCREKVEVQCECGNRKAMRSCQEFMSEYRKIFTAKLQEQIQESQQGGDGFDFKNLYSNVSKKDFKTLECNDACKQLERNRRLDIAFKVQNPNLISLPKFVPNYSEFLRTFYKKDPSFINNIHEKLTELVKLSKESKQKFRSHSFPVMNRDKRHVVHEMCEMFGVESKAFDDEPNRNVVATCYRETSWLPSMSLQEVFQRENGQRKVTAPNNLSWGAKK